MRSPATFAARCSADRCSLVHQLGTAETTPLAPRATCRRTLATPSTADNCAVPAWSINPMASSSLASTLAIPQWSLTSGSSARSPRTLATPQSATEFSARSFAKAVLNELRTMLGVGSFGPTAQARVTSASMCTATKLMPCTLCFLCRATAQPKFAVGCSVRKRMQSP